MERLKFFVVDDSEPFRSGIVFYLEQILRHEVIGQASNGKNFLEQKENYTLADIILMDIQMPKLNGILATKKLLWLHNNKTVIAITDFEDMVGMKDLIYAGFQACVFKNRIYEDLPVAIEDVTNGRMYYPEYV